MNRPFFFILSGILIFCFTSCRQKHTPLLLEEFTAGEDAPFYDSISYPAASLSWSFMVPSEDNKYAQYIRDQIIEIICDTSCGCATFDEAVSFYTTRYQQNYRTDNAYVSDTGKTISKRILALLDGLFEEFKLEPTYNNQGILSLSLYKNCYSGGAHEMQEERAYIFDVTQRKAITYSDLFEDNESVYHLLIHKLLEKFELSQYEDLYDLGFFDHTEFIVTQNVALTTEGVTWIFNPYEIAAYAVGIVKITIPYHDLKPFIKKDCAVNRILK